MILRVESDFIAMYRERGLEIFEFLCGQCFRLKRMSVYIDRFYSAGGITIYLLLFLTEEINIFLVTQLSFLFTNRAGGRHCWYLPLDHFI